jgi:chlorite dismutase
MLPYDARRQLMEGHGRKGREFAGRVLQLVTGSTGLDDFEWGVTLFAADPADLKQCVYELRFDQASAIYAEFGPFVTGLIAPIEDVLASVGASGA